MISDLPPPSKQRGSAATWPTHTGASSARATRIERDRHDELNPTLSGIRIAAAMARRRLESTRPADTLVQLETIEAAAKDSLELIRRIIDDLTPLPLETAGWSTH